MKKQRGNSFEILVSDYGRIRKTLNSMTDMENVYLELMEEQESVEARIGENWYLQYFNNFNPLCLLIIERKRLFK